MAFFLFLMLRARLSYLFTADWETFLSVGYLCVAILCSAYYRQVTFFKIEPSMPLQKRTRKRTFYQFYRAAFVLTTGGSNVEQTFMSQCGSGLFRNDDANPVA